MRLHLALSILAIISASIEITIAVENEYHARADDPPVTYCFTSPGAPVHPLPTSYYTTEIRTTRVKTTTSTDTSTVAPTTLTKTSTSTYTFIDYSYIVTTDTLTLPDIVWTTTVTSTTTPVTRVTKGSTTTTLYPSGWLPIRDTLPRTKPLLNRQEKSSSAGAKASSVTKQSSSTTLSSTTRKTTTTSSRSTTSPTPTTKKSTTTIPFTTTCSSLATSLVICEVWTTQTTTSTAEVVKSITTRVPVATFTEIQNVETIVKRTRTTDYKTYTHTTILTASTYIVQLPETTTTISVPTQTIYAQCTGEANHGLDADIRGIGEIRSSSGLTTKQSCTYDFYSCCVQAVTDSHAAAFAYLNDNNICVIFERATCSGLDQSANLTAVVDPWPFVGYQIGNANCGKFNMLIPPQSQ